MPERERRRRQTAPSEQEREPAAEASPVRDLSDMYADVRSRFVDVFDLPDDFCAHLRAARREVLLAVRSLIDARLEALEKAERHREVGGHSRVTIE